jgi:hypothetical protein
MTASRRRGERPSRAAVAAGRPAAMARAKNIPAAELAPARLWGASRPARRHATFMASNPRLAELEAVSSNDPCNVAIMALSRDSSMYR